MVSGRRSDINAGARAHLFDPVPAEGGSSLHQRHEPRTAGNTGGWQDTVWRHSVRRPTAGEGRGRRGRRHRCRCNHLIDRTSNKGRAKKKQKNKKHRNYFNNQGILLRNSSSPLPQLYTRSDSDKAQEVPQESSGDVTGHKLLSSQVTKGNCGILKSQHAETAATSCRTVRKHTMWGPIGPKNQNLKQKQAKLMWNKVLEQRKTFSAIHHTDTHWGQTRFWEQFDKVQQLLITIGVRVTTENHVIGWVQFLCVDWRACQGGEGPPSTALCPGRGRDTHSQSHTKRNCMHF